MPAFESLTQCTIQLSIQTQLILFVFVFKMLQILVDIDPPV